MSQLILSVAFAQPFALVENSASNNIALFSLDQKGNLIPSMKSFQTVIDPEDWGFYNGNNNYFNVSWSADQLALFSVNTNTGDLSRIQTLATGVNPWALWITPDNKRAYIGNYGENTISQYQVNSDGTFKDLGKFNTEFIGPGHVVTNENDQYLIVVYDLSNTIASYARDSRSCLIT